MTQAQNPVDEKKSYQKALESVSVNHRGNKYYGWNSMWVEFFNC